MSAAPSISRCRPQPGWRSLPWPELAPAIVAEALVPVDHPLETLALPPPGEAGAVARAIAASLRFDQWDGELPAWLRNDQCRSVRRALLALERHGSALLADPTGSGKTYEALAAGLEWPGRGPLLVVAPAAILSQWERTAAGLSIPIAVCSHERVSRGRLPPFRPRMVIVDESHRFRNPATRRYSALAPFLVGIPTLLLSATPVVNRIGDLASQLLLGVRDDALAWHGIPSLAGLLRRGMTHPALGELVISRTQEMAGRPAVTYQERQESELHRPPTVLQGLDTLALSRVPAIASILRTVLYRAAASSPAALEAVLARYRRLLAHAADAQAAGRPLDRRLLRRFTGEQDEQLVLWALIPESATKSELVLGDAGPVEHLLRATRDWMSEPDWKSGQLRSLLRDHRICLLFSNYRETVRYLRNQLAELQPAWCTGERAGIGHVSMPRDAVLAWFAPHRRPTNAGPGVLLTTDVSAEGLDLQLADRVVHYDLPWTTVRLEQREGRAARLGSPHRAVEVLRYQPPPEIEHRLQGQAILQRKHRFPGQAGLGAEGRWLFRWREELLAKLPPGPLAPGVAVIGSREEGVLAGLELSAVTNERRLHVVSVGWLPAGGEWTELPREIETRLFSAAHAADARPATLEEGRRAFEVLWPSLLARLREGRATHWSLATPSAEQSRLHQRLRALVRRAAQERDRSSLTTLERAVRFVGGGHTAGEAALLARLAGCDDAVLERSLVRLPAPTSGWDTVLPRLTGILVFTSFPACQPCAPCSSISTAPSSTRSG